MTNLNADRPAKFDIIKLLGKWPLSGQEQICTLAGKRLLKLSQPCRFIRMRRLISF